VCVRRLQEIATACAQLDRRMGVQSLGVHEDTITVSSVLMRGDRAKGPIATSCASTF